MLYDRYCNNKQERYMVVWIAVPYMYLYFMILIYCVNFKKIMNMIHVYYVGLLRPPVI